MTEISDEGPQFLKKKYNLHTSPEVESATKRTLGLTGETIPQDPNLQIQNYLDRFTKIIERPEPDKRERGIEALKHLLHDKFVIKPEEVPEGYFENQKRIAREQGHGDIEVTDEMRRQLSEVIVTDQKSSLDTWIDYLASPDAIYPDWLKYFAFRSILSMGAYDKEKKEFPKRSKGTTKPFPDLNREALAYVLDVIEKKQKGEESTFFGENPEDKSKFQKLLQGENFSKLYAFAIDKVTPASQEALADTRGEWVKYPQNSDPTPLYTSLQGHGTGWCSAFESTARVQLEKGDFYVYYSLDNEGKPTIPRTAIRMEGDNIAEVRGIAPEQNLDPYINDVVSKKLEEFPDGKLYQKKASDMKHLTAIEYKVTGHQDLSREDLVFLYEIDSTIEGFGYKKDPRIEKLRTTRNPEEDMPTVFDCEPAQIAHTINDINENTRAYVGELIPGIFDAIQNHNIEHLYTSFPEGKIRQDELTIGGKTTEELEKELRDNGINVTSYAASMMQSPNFTTLKDPQELGLVRLHVRDLGIKKYPTIDELYSRAEELGLALCPPETGPQYRLKYTDQPLDERFFIGMKQISDSDGNPSVFDLERRNDGLWLYSGWTNPGHEWYPDFGFVFSLRKS